MPLSSLPSVLLLILFTFTFLQAANAESVSCKVMPAKTFSEAETAFFKGDFAKAATLYETELQRKQADPEIVAGLSQVYLQQQKIKEAHDLVQTALNSHPNSVELTTALAEVQFREGTPWLASEAAAKAMKLDPCYPRLRLLNARLYQLNSFYASAANEIKTAHLLDPNDPRVRRRWLDTLPIRDRIKELESYLATGGGDDPESVAGLHFYLDYLKQQVEQPHKACRLVSNTETTTIPFALIMADAVHVSGFGLDVKFNDHKAKLEIDTGAGGIVISRSVAQRAGLKEFSRTTIGGIGKDTRRSGYVAYADDIKIGSLEFHDCEVEVIDQRNVVDIDGLIGMDVLSHFLITLDYPMRKLDLAPLPPRPGDTAAQAPTLETTGSSAEETASNDATQSPSTTTKAAASYGPHDRYVAPEMKDWTPVYRVGHNLMLPVSLNKTEQRLFILDTGASFTSITPDVARKVTKVHSDDSVIVKGISGKVDKTFSADKIVFQFANISQQVNDVISFDNPQISRGIGMEVSGLIGIGALGHLTIGIDYRDGLMKFHYDANRGFQF